MGYMKAEKVIDGKEFVLRIEHDNDVHETPRDWDNLGKMVCWHRRYDLGDGHDYNDVEDFVMDLAKEVLMQKDNDYLEKLAEEKFSNVRIEYFENHEEIEDGYALIDEDGEVIVEGYGWRGAITADGFETREDAEHELEQLKDEALDIDVYVEEHAEIDDLWELINNSEHYIILPLYLYDHSGITMNTRGFACGWDSGQVGYIYASKDRLREETGYTEKQLFEEGKAREILEGEVEVYDQYLTGDVYGFVLEEKVKCECCGHVEREHVDSCWGFYGDEDRTWAHMKEHLEEKYHVLFDSLEYNY